MEDGLVQCAEAYDKAVKDSLNPYCSGRWSRTGSTSTSRYLKFVLILIVVEDGLVLDKVNAELKKLDVLILIVVEDGLVLLLVK